MQQPGQSTDERQHQVCIEATTMPAKTSTATTGPPVRELAPEGWGSMEDPSARGTAEASCAPTGPVVMEWWSHHRSGRCR